MTRPEILEVTKIHSVVGKLGPKTPIITQRPFKAPHHTASGASLIGGGTFSKPGDISLTHRGVLFLDEFPEFHRDVLESLRQPLEDGVVIVSRAKASFAYPTQFILVAAMNPCPCGYANHPTKTCVCSGVQIKRYQQKISGPLLDRIDLHVEVPQLKYEKLSSEKIAEESESIRKRVEGAREIQRRRFRKVNSEMTIPEIKKYCGTDSVGESLLRNAVDKMNLSGRGYHRILKLARTIADLAEEKNILKNHIAEALQYRQKEEIY
jgi:magnesium chelatase family protein